MPEIARWDKGTSLKVHQKEISDGSDASETPRDRRTLRATGEGESVPAEVRGDDDYKSEGSRPKRAHGGSSEPRKKKKDIIIGTWNMQTMKELGKLELLLREMRCNNISILGLGEVRWKKEGMFTHTIDNDTYTIIYCGNNKGCHGVAIILDPKMSASLKNFNTISDRMVTAQLNTKPVPLNIAQVYAPTSTSTEEEIESFYNILQNYKDSIKDREISIIMGDFNAKIGEGEDKEHGVGAYGLGQRNERGDMLASFCKVNNLIITNTIFKQPKRRRYTWISPGERYKNQIDYILINRNWRTTVMNAKTRPGIDSNTDHVLLVAKLRLKALKQQKRKGPTRYDLDKLSENNTREEFQLDIHNRFTALMQDWTANETYPDEIWNSMKSALAETAEAKLGKKTSRKPKSYISEEVLKLAKEKSAARRNNKREEYKRLKKEIRAKIRRDKETWLEQECSKITEANAHRKSKDLFQQISKVKTKVFQPRTQSIHSKNNEVLTDTEDILNRWHEYGKELFENNTETEHPQTLSYYQHTETEPEPSIEEITKATEELKNGKSPGLDNIPAELLKYSGETGVKAMHHLCSKIWVTCQWPTDWKLQEFVMLYKNGNTKDCGNYRTIALISHASKILLTTILNRMKNKCEEEISDCQAGYRPNRGTTDMLFTLQLLIEKVKNSDKMEAYITFIDYSKAFDSVIHQHLFKNMQKMGFPKHLVHLIAALYQDQKATIRWNGEHCKHFEIKKGVRQGCILSPHLFNIYTEQIMRNADIEDMGVSVGGRNITNLRYADDTALMADNITSMKRILHRVDTAGRKAGLKLNAKKTKVMHIGDEMSGSIKVDNTELENVSDFKYLGSIKTNNGTCTKDIKVRISMAKQKMIELNNIWKDRGISLDLKLKILKCLIWPVITYGCEAWTLRKSETTKIQAAEMWLYRRLLNIHWSDKRTNESILDELAIKRQLLTFINKRRLKYVGHAARNTKTDLMKTTLQGKTCTSRRKGRPPISYTENIRKLAGLTLQEICQKSQDREKWNTFVAQRAKANFEDGDAYG